MDTLYDLLGAMADDDAEDIRAAFRKAVKSAHPDVNAGDPAAALKFRQIMRANEILIDPEQRAVYDHLLNLARIEMEMASKQSVAVAVHKVASGTMALAAVSVVAIVGYLVFMQISSASTARPADVAWKSFQSVASIAASTPAMPGNPKLEDRLPVKGAASASSNSSASAASPTWETNSPTAATASTEVANAAAGAPVSLSGQALATSVPASDAERNDAPSGPVADLYLEPKYPVAYLESSLMLYPPLKLVDKVVNSGHGPKASRPSGPRTIEPPLALTAPPPRQMAAEDPSREESSASSRMH